MAMRKTERERQPTMWMTTTELPTAASRPFYTRLNHLLRERRDPHNRLTRLGV